MKTAAVLIIFFFCLNINAQKAKLYLSTWNGNDNKELIVTSDKYSNYKKGKLYYFLSNDNNNIYIDMKIEDPGVKMRILEQGLTIWVNMDTKLTKKMGIRFPVGSQNPAVRSKPNLSDNSIINDAGPINPLLSANTIELIGFTSEETKRFPADNADNFKGAVRYDNKGTLFYKMIMPITKLPVRNAKGGKGAMPFALGIEYGPLKTQPAFPPILFWIKNIKLATYK